MFDMSQHTYAYAAPAPSRQYSAHSTSSAFSSSANPDEDWTKISDLAERRRIQNRIAQRNYRKKLKRRLEDLERRAATTDGAPAGKDKPSQPSRTSKRQQQAAPKGRQQTQQHSPPAPPQKAMPPQQSQFTPPMHPEDDYLFPPVSYDERERSHTPPLFPYSSYPPPPEDLLLPPYSSAGGSQPYRPVSTDAYPDYLAAPVPVTLPSMSHFGDAAVKREPSFPVEDSLTPYIGYGGYVPGFDMPAGAPSPYDHSNPHTPPLSHSFDHSADCSDSASYGYPTTPLSLPASPGTVHQQM